MTKQIRVGPEHFAMVDDDDFEKVAHIHWQYNPSRGTGYAQSHQQKKVNGRVKTFNSALMHRLVMDCPKGMQVHHINGNGLDNRKENLKIVTRRQNLQGRRGWAKKHSTYKGVSWHKKTQKWHLSIHPEFDTAEEAARAYDKVAKVLYGEHAFLNFPE